MSKYSVKSAAKLYLRQEDEDQLYKYSPFYKKEKAHNIKVAIFNPDLNKAIELTKKKVNLCGISHRLSQSAKMFNPSNRRQQKEVRENMHQFMNKNFQTQRSKFYQSTPTQMKQKQAKKNRSLREKLEQQQKKRKLQQIQFQYKEKQREEQYKSCKQTTERSFIFGIHKESISMIKKSRRIQSKSQARLNQERYLETERNHQFRAWKQSFEKMQQSQELAYKKTFLLNQAFQGTKLTDLRPTLLLSSKATELSQIGQHNLPSIKEGSKKKSFKTHKIPKKQAKQSQYEETEHNQLQSANPEQDPKKNEQTPPQMHGETQIAGIGVESKEEKEVKVEEAIHQEAVSAKK